MPTEKVTLYSFQELIHFVYVQKYLYYSVMLTPTLKVGQCALNFQNLDHLYHYIYSMTKTSYHLVNELKS